MTILTKSLLALTLTQFVAHAHILDLIHSSQEEPSVEYLEATVVWNTASSFADSGHPVDTVYRRLLDWQPETLRFRDVYAISYAAGNVPTDSIPLWAAPLYNAYIVGSNRFAPTTYWTIGACLLLAIVAPKLKRLLFALRGEAAMKCVFCDSKEIRRVPVGAGLLADIRRALGQRAFRCNTCTAKFFRRWNYEGYPMASRAQAS